MSEYFNEVEISQGAYTTTLLCVDTGVKVTMSVPINVPELDRIVERVCRAIAIVGCEKVMETKGGGQ